MLIGSFDSFLDTIDLEAGRLSRFLLVITGQSAFDITPTLLRGQSVQGQFLGASGGVERLGEEQTF